MSGFDHGRHTGVSTEASPTGVRPEPPLVRPHTARARLTLTVSRLGGRGTT